MRMTFLALLLGAAAGPVRADDAIDREARELAKAAGPALRKAGHTEVAVAAPSWADGRPVEAGAGVTEALAGALAAEGFVVKAGAKASLTSVLEKVNDPQTGQPACKLKVALKLGDQERAVGSPRLLFGESALARVFAPRVLALDPKTPERERVRLIAGAAKAPEPPPATKAGMELLVRDRDGTFRPRKATGAKVSFKEFDTYQIRVFSTDPTGPELAVLITIDGLFWDEYAEGTEADAPKGRMVLVKPGQSVTVKGWYVSQSKSYAFDVVALPTFAAASKSEAGVVTAQFFPAWAKDAKPPAGEERAVNHRSVLGTDAIRQQPDDFETAERVVGRLREVHSITYGK